MDSFSSGPPNLISASATYAQDCARVAVWRDFGVTMSYTMEATFSGGDFGGTTPVHFRYVCPCWAVIANRSGARSRMGIRTRCCLINI